MFLDSNRLTQLVELSALDRVTQGPERLGREEALAHFIHAAYGDATEAARADFMARVAKMPTSEWPWTAVRAMSPRAAASIGSVATAPRPSPSPAALVLLRGQAESADIDPGHRLPDRGTPEGASWEPLYRALDAWDTPTILKWIGPQGWVSATGATAGKETGNGAASGAPGGEVNGGKDLPVPQPADAPAIPWTHPAMLAAGAVVVVAAGVVIYTFAQDRGRRRLEDVLSSQEAP